MKSVPAAGRRVGRALRVILRWLLVLLVLLAVVHLTATVITGHRLKRELARLRAAGEPLTLTEMAPEVPEGDQNAAFFYEQAFNALKLSQEEKALEVDDPEKLSEHPSLARKTVAANADYFRLLDRASRVKYCAFNVKWDDPLNALFPHFAKMRQAAQLLAVRSKLRVMDGQADAAAEDCDTTFRIAEHADTEPTLISLMVSVATYGIGLKQLESVLASGDLSPAVTRELLAQLSTADHLKSLERDLGGERAFGIAFFDNMRRRPEQMEGIGESGFHPVQKWLLRLYPTLGRPLMNLDELSFLRIWQDSLTTAETPYPERFARAQGPEAAQERLPEYRSVITRAIMPMYARVFESTYRNTAEINAARLALSLELYRQEYGHYPAGLAALALPLPLDPFTQKPYHYRAEGKGFVVWSVGPDLQDDHGIDVPARERWYPNHPEGKHYDLVFRLTR